MGFLRELATGNTYVLEPEHAVGRGQRAALRLTKTYVSAQHAIIRWTSRGWQLLDCSRNGTRLNGEPLQTRKPYPLSVGTIISFGHVSERWELVDAGAPEVMLIDTASNIVLVGSDGVIGVPSNEDPQATVFRDASGAWCIEQTDGTPTTITNGSSVEVNGRIFRFSCPETVVATVSADWATPVESAVFHFRVSRDEEFVELSMEAPERTVALGFRAQNYLLLTLARARLADRASGLPETSCGWVYKEELADGLLTTPTQIDGDVFRIRKHFGECGLNELASVIERRPRTRQLRIGLERLKITTV